MKRKLYFLFLVLIKPSRLFRLSWRARLARGWSGSHRLRWGLAENILTKERKSIWMPDWDYRDLTLAEYHAEKFRKITEAEYIKSLRATSPILETLKFKKQ